MEVPPNGLAFVLELRSPPPNGFGAADGVVGVLPPNGFGAVVVGAVVVGLPPKGEAAGVVVVVVTFPPNGLAAGFVVDGVVVVLTPNGFGVAVGAKAVTLPPKGEAAGFEVELAPPNGFGAVAPPKPLNVEAILRVRLLSLGTRFTL